MNLTADYKDGCFYGTINGLTSAQERRLHALALKTEADIDAGPIAILDGTVLAHDVAVLVYNQGALTRTVIDIGEQPRRGGQTGANLIVKVPPTRAERERAREEWSW